MARMMARILYIVSSSIYSIFPIPLHTTWDTPAYIRNFPYHGMIPARFPDHPIKIKWYDLNTIPYHDMVSTPHIPDHTTPFRPVLRSSSIDITLIAILASLSLSIILLLSLSSIDSSRYRLTTSKTLAETIVYDNSIISNSS